MKIISVRSHPEYEEKVIDYISSRWPDVSASIYKDCISHSVTSESVLPHWYVLEKSAQFIGCAGLITNDFISRMDLWPWLCALFIDEKHRGHSYGSLLIDQVKEDAKRVGFKNLYLCTDHIGLYEKYGFKYIGDGYHPWGEHSRIYEISL